MFTAQYFKCSGLRCSPLNAALVASGKNVAKAENLRRLNCAILFSFVSGYRLLKLCSILILWFCFAVSDANSLVESQPCDIAFPKGFWGAFSQISTALLIPSGFSGRRFETAPDLSFSRRSKTVLAKW